MDLERLLGRALALGDEGDWHAVAELLRESASDFDEEPALHCWLGVAERELGLDGVAYERFKRALALGPTDPHVLATAGSGVAAFDDPDAELALRTAALMAPELPVARMLYGAYLSREGFTERALEELRAARDLAPEDAQILYELGVAWALAGDHERAADALAEAVAADPSDAWARVTFGLVLIESERFEEAFAELLEAGALAPEDVEAQVLAALTAAACDRDDLALDALERARMRSAPEDQVILSAAEDRLDDGVDAARALLLDELVPDALRRRLAERPR